MFGFLNRQAAGRVREAGAEKPVLDSARIVEIMESFPIGGKIRYFPTPRKDILLESLIIAYGINHYMVYTQNDIHVERPDNAPPRILLDDDWKDVAVDRIHNFCFVIPDVGITGKDLDYVSRAALKTGGWFQRGEQFTLMSLFTQRGVPHIDAVIRKNVLLKEGYYANHSVVIMEVLPDSLTYVDQRQHHRIKTSIPVNVYLSEEGEAFPCMLVDFTESSFKVCLEGQAALARQLGRRRSVIVAIDLPAQMRSFILKGRVLRRDESHVVLSLKSRLVGDQFEDMDLMAAIDLKASLLQHPETR
ncbi:MAG TPA: PilZ domain-containing protein [Gammaproteobacteria bacterium]|nr:PilZ domain-containing protein [Gammaproteobacteria bacterium]